VNPAVLTATAVLAAFVAICLVDIARAEDLRHLPKWSWAGICLVLVSLGGLFYLGIGRTRRP
jgi:hypothetical protein